MGRRIPSFLIGLATEKEEVESIINSLPRISGSEVNMFSGGQSVLCICVFSI
jgi:hypothetical protein